MAKNWTIYKKLHKWPGLLIAFVLLYYAITGIFMNHRELFSGLEVSRSVLPDEYSYQNWNNSGLKGNLIINPDSILVFGNIGIWITDSTFQRYSSFNEGFPNGSDNRKIFDVHRTPDGNLYSATLLGLYAYSNKDKIWSKFELNSGNNRFSGIESIGDTVYAINRSHLFKGKSEGNKTIFRKIELLAPEGYENKITLFQTLWQIHSGEIFGLPGQVFVDLLGMITIFLSGTGIIYFFFPGWMKRRFKRNKPAIQIANMNKWSLRWHNKIGAWTFVLLIVLFFTGMFLRPPLLIAIANARLSPIKYSHLDQPNPWYDKLRDILYDEKRKFLLLSTSEGMYFMKADDLVPIRFQIQPPVSVMGINTFKHFGDSAYLIGSFSGLFLWHPSYPEIYNYATGAIYQPNTGGRPIGDFKITGTIDGVDGSQYLVDYDKGTMPLWHKSGFPEMPENILKVSKMSFWNVCLEIHTGRIFQSVIGNFYLLIVPIGGLISIVVVLSGYLLWRRKYRRQL